MANYKNIEKRKFRDLRSVIENGEIGFALAYERGVMGLLGMPASGRALRLRGHEGAVTDFARGSYLGLDTHPKITAGAIAAIQEYGALQCNTARTRLSFDIADRLEQELSSLFSSRAVLSSLVLTANMAALPLIASGAFSNWEPPVMVFDRLAHATLAFHKPVVAEDAEVVTIDHNDINALEDLCKRHRHVAYVLDGIYSMGGQAPMEQLLDLQQRYGLFLYIDDAHGTSVYGEVGEGYARQMIGGALNERTMIVASLGKAFGAAGAALLLGSQQQERLITRYGVPYAFAIGPNVAAIGAALASVEIHRSAELGQRQARLRTLLETFDALVPTEQAGAQMPIRMIPLGEDRLAIACAEWLLGQGFYLTAAFYPTVGRGRAGLRLCITADHTVAEIGHIARLLDQWRAENLA